MRRARVVVKSRRHRLVYAGRWPLAALAVTLTLVAIVITVASGQIIVGLSPVVLVAAWLSYAVRLQRLVPAGTRGGGPGSAPGAGVREPRRPLPKSPAGAAERSLPVM
jgi:hypothetical protein